MELGEDELGVVDGREVVGVEDQPRTPRAVVEDGVDVERRDRAVVVRGQQVVDRDLARGSRVHESGERMDEHRRVGVDVVREDLVQGLGLHVVHSRAQGTTAPPRSSAPRNAALSRGIP